MNRNAYDRELMEMAASLSDKDRHKFIDIIQRETFNPVTVFGWSVWLGWFGIDRFVIGDILAGVLKFLTLGGFGLWYLLDCFIIGGRTRNKNMDKIHDIYAFVNETSTA